MRTMTNWVVLTAAVPSDRVDDFYKQHAEWLTGPATNAATTVDKETAAGPQAPRTPAPRTPPAAPTVPWRAEDGPIAARVWPQFSDHAKSLMRVMMSEPGRKFGGEALAEECGIPNGRYGVAGTLAWLKRHCAAAGKYMSVKFEYGPAGAGAWYWVDQATAEAFATVAKMG